MCRPSAGAPDEERFRDVSPALPLAPQPEGFIPPENALGAS